MIIYQNQEISEERILEMLSEEKAQTFSYVGDMLISFCSPDTREANSQLLIAYCEEWGYYMSYHEVTSGQEWLSLWDRERLDDVIEYDEDCFVSAGLFVPFEIAIEVISDYVWTGSRGNQIAWIEPEEVPDTGNWA